VTATNQNQINKISEIDKPASNIIFYSVVFGMFITQNLLALSIDDLTLVFGFISAFAEASVSFIFPGLFYFIGARKALKKVSKTLLLGSLAFSFFGVAYFFISNYFNFIKLMRNQ